jgi:hypothetical protein
MGSFLRVTGSTLWAPGTAAADPSGIGPAVNRTEPSSFAVTEDDVGAPSSSLYTSSVEMVTTPDEYPIWRTRKPVVVVIHNSRKSVQHHFYRYLVVSPGGALSVGIGDMVMSVREDDDAAVVSTSSETAESTSVVSWEDPFNALRRAHAENSAVSLSSSIGAGQIAPNDYRNLPYRTLDIDVATGTPSFDEGEGRPDMWNKSDDITFRPYCIREAVRTLLFYLKSLIIDRNVGPQTAARSPLFMCF